MNIIHRLTSLPPVTGWNDTFKDHICTSIEFLVYSADTARPGNNAVDTYLTVKTWNTIQLDPPDPANFIPYNTIIADRAKYVNAWIEQKADIVASQTANEAALNAIV
jgi:hypothetical protein